MSARSQRLRGSLGESWEEPDYSSDDGASIYSASDLEADPEIDSDFEDADMQEENKDIPTPLPKRTTRASSQTPQDTPVKTPMNRLPRQSQTPRSSPHSQPRSRRSTPGSQSLEPSLIMPSIRRVSAAMPRQDPAGQPASDPDVWHYLGLFRNHVVFPLVQYLLSVVGDAMHIFKPIFALALVIGVVAMALAPTSMIIQKSLQAAIMPVCMVPGSTYLIPFCRSTNSEDSVVDFQEVGEIQTSFEDILRDSQETYELPRSMKRSEASIRDLKLLVKHSKIPSKAQLEVELQAFIETAAEAVRDLTRYNGRIGYTVDRVINSNRESYRVIDGLAGREVSAGAVSRVLGALNPFNAFLSKQTLDEILHEQYVIHIRDVKDAIGDLIQQAEALLMLLNHLENKLEVIGDLGLQDENTLGQDHAELLGRLWTKLGGNRGQTAQLKRSLQLLNQVTSYRKQAAEHVAATLLKLQAIGVRLENLRDGVSAPEVLGYRKEISLRYHLEVIAASVENLQKVRGEHLLEEKKAYSRIFGNDDRQESLGSGTREMPIVSARPKV
ncbi:hypothetical protein EJ04DRAFT_431477 [Polyplosphaeria fusca]|uniref:Uncharacterized protein n=1 Tax=Polyplosphaeria fusca TaxID=682080 RepID=A0A9P4R553_9PLEO|nr:hypothetical protein EJ04DRAFT_431477 [Polyplosphaeria fusca]